MSSILGLAFSKEGKEATSTDPRDLVWSSQYSSLAIWMQDGGTATSHVDYVPGWYEWTVTIDHNLDYIPTALVFGDDYSVWGENIPSTTGECMTPAQFYVTSTQLVIKFYRENTAPDPRYYYYIFLEKTSDTVSSLDLPVVNPYGMKMVKEGADVSSQRLDDLVFSSDYPPLKMADTYERTVTWTSSASPVTKYEYIPHNLGFVPAFTATVEPINPSTGAVLMGFVTMPWPGGMGQPAYGIFADSTNIIITVYNPGETATRTTRFRVTVFADKGAP